MAEIPEWAIKLTKNALSQTLSDWDFITTKRRYHETALRHQAMTCLIARTIFIIGIAFTTRPFEPLNIIDPLWQNVKNLDSTINKDLILYVAWPIASVVVGCMTGYYLGCLLYSINMGIRTSFKTWSANDARLSNDQIRYIIRRLIDRAFLTGDVQLKGIDRTNINVDILLYLYTLGDTKSDIESRLQGPKERHEKAMEAIQEIQKVKIIETAEDGKRISKLKEHPLKAFLMTFDGRSTKQGLVVRALLELQNYIINSIKLLKTKGAHKAANWADAQQALQQHGNPAKAIALCKDRRTLLNSRKNSMNDRIDELNTLKQALSKNYLANKKKIQLLLLEINTEDIGPKSRTDSYKASINDAIINEKRQLKDIRNNLININDTAKAREQVELAINVLTGICTRLDSDIRSMPSIPDALLDLDAYLNNGGLIPTETTTIESAAEKTQTCAQEQWEKLPQGKRTATAARQILDGVKKVLTPPNSGAAAS